MSALARALRKRSTRAERLVWRWLRDRRLFGFKFRRQHPLAGYVLDFYCPDLGLCIEIDGSVHDRGMKAKHDSRRTRELSKLGIEVVRLRNEDTLRQPDASWEWIACAVAEAMSRRTGRSATDLLRELYYGNRR